MNKDKIIREAINQGKNAMLKASLPDNSGNQGMNRQPIVTAGEPSELDKQMQLAGVKKVFRQLHEKKLNQNNFKILIHAISNS